MGYERIKNTELSQLYEFVLFGETYLMPFFQRHWDNTLSKNFLWDGDAGFIKVEKCWFF